MKKSENQHNLLLEHFLVKHSLNAHHFPKQYQVTDQLSVTIPDMSLSIKEILQNHTRGIPMPSLEEIYEGDDIYLPDIHTLDLAERQELKEQYQEQLKSIRQKIQDEQLRDIATQQVQPPQLPSSSTGSTTTSTSSTNEQ